jgi:hypothetical protein
MLKKPWESDSSQKENFPMPRLTIQDRLIQALTAMGYRRDMHYYGRKYATYIKNDVEEDKKKFYRRIYVGSHGTLRGGETVVSSIKLDRFKNTLLESVPATEEKVTRKAKDNNKPIIDDGDWVF